MTAAHSSTPKIITRSPQPFAALRGLVPMDGIPEFADRMPQVWRWLDTVGIKPTGPAFFRYTLIDMSTALGMEIGWPVTEQLDPPCGQMDLISGTLPGGRYVTMLHVGPPETLMQATSDLLDWAQREGLSWDMEERDDGEHWACRLEEYLSDADADPATWETYLTFKLADR